jgi:hypothetical protein
MWRNAFDAVLRVQQLAVLFAVLGLLALYGARATAQPAGSPPLAAIIVDATGDETIDARTRGEVIERLRQKGYEVVSRAQLDAALSAQNAYVAGSPTRDPSTLERVRLALPAAVLVRVARSSGGYDWVGTDISVYSASGRANTSSVAKLTDAPGKIGSDVAPLIPPAAAAAVPGPPPPAAAGASPDIVLLADGSQVQGRIVNEVPGQMVVVDAIDGRRHVIPWNGIARIIRSGAPQLQGTPNTQQAGVDPQGRQLGAQYQHDCAVDPSHEICKQQGGVQVGPGGLQAGWSQETLTAVKEPRSGSVDFAIDGSFLYGTFSGEAIAGQELDFEIYGGGVSVGFKILTGKQFPGPEGGGWLGFFIDPMLSVQGAGGEMTIPEQSIGTVTVPEFRQGFGMLLINGGASGGLQWMRFGKMDPQTLKQGGFGLNAGYRIGMQFSQMYVEGGSGDGQTDFSHGPVFGLSFPSYNAGTAQLSRAYLQAMILPTGDFLMITVAGGYAF